MPPAPRFAVVLFPLLLALGGVLHAGTPPLLLATGGGMGGPAAAGMQAAGGEGDALSCRTLAIRYEMEGWAILGACALRYCQVLDEQGDPLSLGGIPLAWIELDCGPLDGTEMSDAPSGFH